MRRITSVSLLTLFLLISVTGLYSQDIQEDSVATGLHLDDTYLEQQSQEDEFDYHISHARNASLFDRIKAFLLALLLSIFQWGNDSWIGRIFLYGLIVGAIVYTIMKLIGRSPARLLQKQENELSYDVKTEDIHAISFADQLAEALEKKNYKLAVRLQYLWTLKHLTDRGSIHWKPGKSNRDYAYELARTGYKQPFDMLSHSFDQHWYSGLPVHKDDFEKTKALSQQIRNA